MAYYLSVQADALRLRILRIALCIAAALLVVLAAAAALVTAVVLVLCGVAQGLAALLGGRAWAGDLAAGTLVLAAVGLAVWLGINAMLRSSKRKTVEKYEHRRAREREDLGRDVGQAAASRKADL